MLKQSNEQDLVLCADKILMPSTREALHAQPTICLVKCPPMTELLSPNLRGGTLEEVQ